MGGILEVDCMKLWRKVFLTKKNRHIMLNLRFSDLLLAGIDTERGTLLFTTQPIQDKKKIIFKFKTEVEDVRQR
jgi:hypothetical protein